MTTELGRHLSPWRDLEEPGLGTAALPDGRADVLVAGAGVTGITTALLLQQAGLKVVVVEAARLGEASVTTHSTVKVTVGHRCALSEIEDSSGQDAAAAYAAANMAGFATLLGLVDSLDIPCMLETGLSHVVYAEDPQELPILEREAELAARLGLPAGLSESAPLPFKVAGALEFHDQAQFHPARYLFGLTAAFIEAGGSLVVGTRVLGIEEGPDGCEVTTSAGDVSAGHVVVATQYPILDRGGQFTRMHAHRSYGIAGILPGGMSSGMTMNVGSPTRSTRQLEMNGEKLLIVVGEGHQVGSAQDTAERWGRLHEWATARFGVEDLRYHWSSQEVESVDHVPLVGFSSALSERVLTATGFGGWGMTNGTAAAMMLRDLILERENPWVEVFDARRAVKRIPSREVLKQNIGVATTWLKDRVSSGEDLAAEDLRPGDAAIVSVAGEKAAAHRDAEGVLHCVSATCTHMGCTVGWNAAENSWDCPCHGSRFDVDGRVLQAPATDPLRPVEMTPEPAGHGPKDSG